MVLVLGSAEAVIGLGKSVAQLPILSLGLYKVAVMPSRIQHRMQGNLWCHGSQACPKPLGNMEEKTELRLTLAGKNWSNAQDLPLGFRPARALEPL